ncbi:MAG: glucose 1-dehydrogenase [Rhizobiales bacterium]|nr:glucose 1-dehydrogenase [Hyphomicrobiales bacterium]
MRVVLITGATGGIGRALCRQFAQAGDRVVAVDLDPVAVAALAAELGPAHRGFACDVASEAAVARLIADVGADLGRLDVVVNNAAIGPTMTPTSAMTMAAIRQTLAVNLSGPFLVAREAARFMAPRGGGVIVNTASLAGIVPNPKRNAYAASKAGVISLTRALANEWAGSGIRVCAVAPGYVRTPMVADLERDGLADLMSVRRRIPMGRIGRPDEIASAIGFLASDRARYITGTTLVVDGGWQAFNAAGNAYEATMVPAEELAPPPAKPASQVALVTGAARGIGRATALRLASQGYRLALMDSDAATLAALAAEMGAPHRGFAVDITDETAVMAAFGTVAREFGQLDLLVNNAAIADSFKPTLDQSRAEFDRIIEVNLVGAMLCAREAVKLMTPRGGGVIVNLASIAGHLPLSPRNAYSASKAAVINLTGCMAAELAPDRIRVVAVAPGYIRTPGVAALEQAAKIDAAAIRRRIPMGDLGQPDDIADAIAFLASDEASYITGTTLFVDGGWSAFGAAGDASTGAQAG